jgi:hypothetical protein
MLLLNLNLELELEEFGLGTVGYFFVTGSRVFGMTVETSADVVSVLLFLRF